MQLVAEKLLRVWQPSYFMNSYLKLVIKNMKLDCPFDEIEFYLCEIDLKMV